MIIDDEPDMLSIIKMTLERCSFSCSVEAFSNPIDALAKFRENPHNYSLVLSDLRMSGMNGFELAREIKKIRHDTLVIFMTAFDIDENMAGYTPSLKKEQILRKPQDILELCGILEQKLVKVVKS